jgi:carbamoyltransferase
MYILGISAMSHDSAAALLNERGIVAAIEEGKLQRSRRTGGIPRAAIQSCFDHAAIGWGDVSCVAVASQPANDKASRQVDAERNDLRALSKVAGIPSKRFKTFDHHLCHAASAFFGSPFERALIVSMDERGDGRSGLIAVGKGGALRQRESMRLPHSLAWIYSQFTQLLGFRPHTDEHKTQWLSLVGEPEYAGLFLDLFRRGPGGPPYLNTKFFRRRSTEELCFTRDFFRTVGIAYNPKRPGAPELPEGVKANLAASLQQAISIVVCDWLENLREKSRENSLCLAGGLFQNPLLVAAIETKTHFENVFVQPATGNEGTALGAAWLAWQEANPKSAYRSVALPLWGPSYSNAQIKLVLDNCKANYRWLDSEEMKISETLRLLTAGKIVAFFQGATEFGPRALGDRSLLASPWAPYVKENLNDFVKHRESFRPFALAIPEDDASRFFNASPNARFLTTMAQATEAGQELLRGLPEGFLLRDNLVRLQVVRETDNSLFWKLLKRSGENAPAPILVNTSFNLFGEPLVVNPRDAVRSYFCSGTDALVAGNFLLEKH